VVGGLAEVEEARHVRVIQAREGLGLTLEARLQDRVGAIVLELHDDTPPELAVAGQERRAGERAAEGAEDLVAPIDVDGAVRLANELGRDGHDAPRDSDETDQMAIP
jgi:hypothetical protein